MMGAILTKLFELGPVWMGQSDPNNQDYCNLMPIKRNNPRALVAKLLNFVTNLNNLVSIAYVVKLP